MSDRREFLASAGMAALATSWGPLGARASAAFDSTWLTYAPDAEHFWASLPFLGRLRKIAEAGFSRYEFGRWKTKDIDAIAGLNEELGLQAALFTGYPGIKGPRWKEGLLDTIEDAAELAPRLGAGKVSVIAADRDEKVERDEQVEDLVDALKEAAGKVAESEVVLILEPTIAAPGKAKPLIGSPEEAAAVVKAVGSPRVRFAFDVRPPRVAGDRDAVDQIRAFKDQVGYYRLADLGHPASKVDHPKVLRAIHDTGHVDPIGLAIAERANPSLVIEELRKADAAAKGA